MNMPFVLFISGINDRGIAQIIQINQENQLLYKGDGSCDLSSYLESNEFEKQKLILASHADSEVRIRRKPDLVFNEIADADSHRVTLKKASQIVSQLNCPVLNHPDLILRTSRDQIYQQLKDIPGVIVPLTLRCAPRRPQDVIQQIAGSELLFPVIVRECGLHNGDHTVLLKNASEIEALNRFAFDGREFYLIQFIDYSQNGVYLKYRVMMIAGQVYFNHLCYAPFWNLHHGTALPYMQAHPGQQDREIRLFDSFEQELKPLIDQSLRQIYRCLPLDYFGIDFALNQQNHMIVFEVNPNMRLGLKNNEVSRYAKNRLQLKHAIIQMIQRLLHDKTIN